MAGDKDEPASGCDGPCADSRGGIAPPDAKTTPVHAVGEPTAVQGPAAGPFSPTMPVPGAAPSPFGPGLRTSSEGSGPARGPRRLGPYQLGEELGQGGFGRVYRARHTGLGAECAVKVLIAGEPAAPESIARFQREAAFVARMGKHPNIVGVHDFGAEGALAWYAMERVEGESLHAARRARVFSWEETAGLVDKIARALQFAHEQRVIHRDLNPKNVVLRAADGEPQVLDFGLAQEQAAHSAEAGDDSGGVTMPRPAAGRTAAGYPIATAAYRAPEQELGDLAAIDARTDVYGIGGILYELLTGGPPHPGDYPRNVESIVNGDVTPPRRVRREIPRDLETNCLKCLAPERERRYAPALDVAEDLARWRCGEPVPASRPSVAYRAWRWSVRRKAVVPPVAALREGWLRGSTGTRTRSACCWMPCRRTQDSWKCIPRLPELRRRARTSRRRPAGTRWDGSPTLGISTTLSDLETSCVKPLIEPRVKGGTGANYDGAA
ncbi:MAG: serine/threonine protein kinase [Planctomycetes bacterium]|nr:serine/threonine protein kinase [Planctomycetota bacterium]